MTRRLVIRPAARIELVEGSDWFDAKSPRRGGEFIRAFEAASAAIVENPFQYFQYQVIYRDVRRPPLRKFPYGLICTVSDNEIVVVSCFHGRRDPGRWQDRIRE